jgi:hypothetical protein
VVQLTFAGNVESVFSLYAPIVAVLAILDALSVTFRLAGRIRQNVMLRASNLICWESQCEEQKQVFHARNIQRERLAVKRD